MLRYKVSEQDILISCVGTFGKILQVPLNFEKGIINPRLIKISTNKSIISADYLERVLRSTLVSFQLDALSRGGTMGVINLELLKKLIIPLPTLLEQLKISEILESKEATFEKSIVELNLSIDKLKLYRQSLISEAVTGKIDLRDWKAPETNNKPNLN